MNEAQETVTCDSCETEVENSTTCPTADAAMCVAGAVPARADFFHQTRA